MYTGLLDYVHAAAMEVLGVHLLTPRVLMLVAVALWLPAVWSIAHRLVRSPVAAAAVTMVALLAGPPNYPAAMPSWYNLFFATWGLWALIRWTDDRRSRWLLAVGIAAGLSILFKVTGLYLLAGALFYVLHDESTRGTERASASSPSVFRAFPLAAAFVVALLILMETALVRSQIGLATWVSYVFPSALLGAALVWRSREVEHGRAALRRTVANWACLVTGVLAAVLPFLAWYAVSGGLDDLYRGVVVLPAERFTEVALPVPPLSRTWTIIIPTVLLIVGAAVGRRYRTGIATAVLVGSAVLMLRMNVRIFIAVFDSLLLVVPTVVAAGATASFWGRRGSVPDDPPLVATLWILALIHLIRYPFAVPIYFGYVAPLAVLAVGGVLARLSARDTPRLHPLVPRRAVLAAVTLAYAVFFVWGPNRGALLGPLPPLEETRLPLARGRISVPISDATEYTRLVEVVRDLTRSRYVYAAPDAPEVSFLSGLENPTRSLFEIFEDDHSRTDRTLASLKAHDVNVIVVNTRAQFSSMPADLVAALVAEYPDQMRIGKFLVRWQSSPP
ncbi:MAG: glycosyltransferase family 39 protein [Gemmatimonadota bacterium]|nr:glycosyltransferase family 39 protein [Gemmatimonadota bacterium]